ncbi:MAG: hypothetical protein F7C09_05810 [Aeropyrum sp.]|nr:hypothetical protein [Aeropyrum sp.]
MTEEMTLKENITVPSGLINAVIAGYQIALTKTLGRGSAAMTQLLIRDIGQVLEEMLEELGFVPREIKDLGEDMSKAFKMLGISDNVEVIIPGDGVEKDAKYVIKIYDSVFKPAARLLYKKGITFTLSPESFLAAALVRAAIRKVKPDAQVKIKVNPQKSPDEPLEIEVIVR